MGLKEGDKIERVRRVKEGDEIEGQWSGKASDKRDLYLAQSPTNLNDWRHSSYD